MPPQGPSPTVDLLIEIEVAGEAGLVLVERKFEPRGWALPGGFIDRGETAASAARREAREETDLEVELKELFHVYSDPSRDARRHTMSVVFIATSAGGEPRGGDDAAQARAFELRRLPAPLAFDHATIIADYQRYRASGQRPPVDR